MRIHLITADGCRKIAETGMSDEKPRVWRQPLRRELRSIIMNPESEEMTFMRVREYEFRGQYDHEDRPIYEEILNDDCRQT